MPEDWSTRTNSHSLRRRQRKARQSLAKLEPSQIYHHDHAWMLKQNIRAIIQGTAEDISDSDSETLQRSRVSTFHDDTSHADPSQWRQKRKITSQEIPAQSKASVNSNHRPTKKRKIDTKGVKADQPFKLSDLRPQPLQIPFPPHPEEDYSDAWFINEFTKLYERMKRFAWDYFLVQDMNRGNQLPWAVDMGPEFLNYVKEVAVEDPMDGGWNDLLMEAEQRKWLVVGFLTKVIERKIFNEFLWGADQQEENMLFGIDKALFLREGYERNALRAQAVRTILGGRPLTNGFHNSVAQLTAQVAVMLNPLLAYLDTLPPEAGAVRLEETLHYTDLYQALHNIIASAGYLSICIRLSPTVLYMVPVLPNSSLDPVDHAVAAPEILQRSCDAWERNHAIRIAVWENEYLELDAAYVKAPSPRKLKALDALALQKPLTPKRTMRPMAKICIWPTIRRFKPGSTEDEKNKAKLQDSDGHRIREISRGLAVFYLGVDDMATRARQKRPLGTFVKEQKKIMKAAVAAAKKAEEQEEQLVPDVVAYGLAMAGGLTLSAWNMSNLDPGTHRVRDVLQSGVENIVVKAAEFLGMDRVAALLR